MISAKEPKKRYINKDSSKSEELNEAKEANEKGEKNMSSNENLEKPDAKSKKSEVETKTQFVKLDFDEYQKKYPGKFKFKIINRISRPISVILTKGFEDFQKVLDVNGYPVLRKEIPDCLRQCPDINLFLLSRGQNDSVKEISVPNEEIIFCGNYLQSLLEKGYVHLRQLDDNGKWTDVSYFEYVSRRKTLEKGFK